ncbi:MAG: hypothetical protein A3E85_04295 [Gammaproteobacteria bacterium RIFCSPHIGHO2_12_FULL_45_12]|nr:MAG: hypothetical protein A3E85_04295 [Gammaproteobacteria bacterium RIFCSPHIGHO2_12_FULL_45_12]
MSLSRQHRGLFARKKPCCDTNQVLLRLEGQNNFVATTIGSAQTLAWVFTLLSDATPVFMGFGKVPLILASLIAPLFGGAETYGHYQQSSHISGTAERNTHVFHRQERSLSLKQKLFIMGDFVASTVNGSAFIFAFCQYGDAGRLSYGKQLAICGGALAYSAMGNLRDLKNSIIATREENSRDEEDAPHGNLSSRELFWLMMGAQNEFVGMSTGMFISLSSLLTYVFRLEQDVMGLSSRAMYFSIVPSLLAAGTTAYTGYQQARHVANIEQENDAELAPLTWKQLGMVGLHFVNDVVDDSSNICTLLFIFGALSGLSTGVNLAIVMSIAIYMGLGNKQEIEKTVSAIQGEADRGGYFKRQVSRYIEEEMAACVPAAGNHNKEVEALEWGELLKNAVSEITTVKQQQEQQPSITLFAPYLKGGKPYNETDSLLGAYEVERKEIARSLSA